MRCVLTCCRYEVLSGSLRTGLCANCNLKIMALGCVDRLSVVDWEKSFHGAMNVNQKRHESMFLVTEWNAAEANFKAFWTKRATQLETPQCCITWRELQSTFCWRSTRVGRVAKCGRDFDLNQFQNFDFPTDRWRCFQGSGAGCKTVWPSPLDPRLS